jgi:hypothetical protein
MSDQELARLVAAERWAFQRCERLRGYPEDIQAAAQASWEQAREELRKYREDHPELSTRPPSR